MIQKNYHNIATLETEMSMVKAQQSSYEDRLTYVSQQLQEALIHNSELLARINLLENQLRSTIITFLYSPQSSQRHNSSDITYLLSGWLVPFSSFQQSKHISAIV